MDVVFLKLLNMSITASWLIVAVVVLRLLLKKAPKWLSCVLWAVVAIRLICPFSFESNFSVIPEKISTGAIISDWADDYVGSTQTIFDTYDGYNAAVENGRKPVSAGEPSHYYVVTAEDGISEPPTVADTWIPILSVIWIAGIGAMLLYAVISYLRLRRRVSAAMPLQDNIWICDEIKIPFILGIIKPRIYLPSDIDAAQISHVVAHENAHLKRRDHWWKPLGFVLAAVYWFNPLIWLAYILLCRDIELACDERVVKKMGIEDKKAYSDALLSCSVPRRMIAACPLAFGEIGVKERIKAILNYKKTAFWVIAAAVIACIVVTVCFLTNPKAPDTVKSTQIALERHPLTYAKDNSTLLSTADFMLEDGKLGKLSLYGSQLENGNYGVSHVQIIWGNGTTTSFDIKEAVAATWGEGDRTEAWTEDGGLVMADFNFDGYTDIALQAWVPVYNHPDYYWFYNRFTGEFEYFGCLNGEAVVDGTNREFTIEHRDGATYYTDHYRPDDANSVYLAQRDVVIYGENRETMRTETYGKNEHPITYADFDRNGTDESVVVVDRGDFVYDVQVRRQDGTALWQQELATVHAGWSSLFLHIDADGAALLQYSPYMSTGSAYYSYTLFTLKDGHENILSKGELSFASDGKDAPEKAEFDSFADGINGLLTDSFLLFSTENGKVEYGLKSAEGHYETFSNLDWLRGES